MEKVNLQTADMVDENIKRIGELFPNCLTERLNDEGKPEVAIDFDQLRQELSKDIVEGSEERYQFTWPDKRNAIRLANAPTTDTLRPCREESVDFDNTQNLYIEGDNLQVLKLLRENYLGKVKMIYIDPPYNTGNDFVYNDNFDQDKQEYVHNSGQYDEEGYQLVANPESNGRYHTDWLNMIYPRLKVAKDLLSEDGVMFISIGEEELDNIIKISSDIFGASNKVSIISRVAKTASNKGTFFAPSVDFIVVFAKNISLLKPFVGEVDESLYKKIESDGEMKGKKYRDDIALYQSALDPLRGCLNQRYYIEAPDGSLLLPPGISFPPQKIDGCFVAPQNRNDKVWRWSYASYFQNKHLLVFKETKTSPLIDQDGNQAKYNIYTKSYLDERKNTGTLPRNIWDKFINRKGADLLKKMDIPFDFSKPVELIDYILQIVALNKGDVVLDFFSGSATTAHALLKRNADDSCNRRYIMVQLAEQTSKESEAYKAGYKNICEIGKERIRRAGKKIKEEHPEAKDLDTGFRVLKLDSSNMQDVYYTPADFNEQKLFDDNIKPDRLGNDGEDLLFQTMIELGIELSAKIEKRSIAGKEVWSVSDGYLMACFDEEVNETTITEIARQHPYYFVMRDSSLANDQVADNFEQIWEEYSKDTVRRIL
jgi:adenine-specific DNA-methyltransferase